jgi:hypothetical protein
LFTEVCRKYAENARNMQLIRKLWEDTQKEVMGMREVLHAVREKVVNQVSPHLSNKSAIY